MNWADPALTPVHYRGVMSWLTPQGGVVEAGLNPPF